MLWYTRRQLPPQGTGMASFPRRILKSAVPSALILAACGYLIAEVAGSWFEANNTTRTHEPGAIPAALRQRLPLTMAAWGFALVGLYELIRGLWIRQPTPAPPPAVSSAEDQLQQLLREAEARNLAATPPPTGCPSPVGADNTAP
jgi:hypothetical protein